MNIIDYLNPTGHLTLHKRFSDGEEELVFDDGNIVVSGMSVGLSILFSLSGSQTITDFHLDRFQVGTSGASVGTAVSSLYKVEGALETISQYGANGSNLNLVSSTQIQNGVDVADQVFALIPFHNVTRVNDTSVRYTLILDEDAANGYFIDEIGLFMKNPEGRVSTASIMTNYKIFSGITKSADYALVWRWTINW